MNTSLQRAEKYYRLLLHFMRVKGLSRREKSAKIDYYVEHLTRIFDEYLSEIRKIGVPPKHIKEILQRLKPLSLKLLELIPDLMSFEGIDFLNVIQLIFLIYESMPQDHIKKIIEGIVDAINDEIILSEIADFAYELGLIDIANKSLKKLYKQGIKRFEIVYNIALTDYMMGNNEEARKILISFKKKQKPILHLLGAISIARGDFNLAKTYLKKVRN